MLSENLLSIRSVGRTWERFGQLAAVQTPDLMINTPDFHR